MLGVLLVLGVWSYSARPERPNGDQADLSPRKPGVFRIAFGSCAKQWKPNYMWRAIINCKPDVWIWLGDSIYAATEDMACLKSQYEKQKANADYVEVILDMPILLGFAYWSRPAIPYSLRRY